MKIPHKPESLLTWSPSASSLEMGAIQPIAAPLESLIPKTPIILLQRVSPPSLCGLVVAVLLNSRPHGAIAELGSAVRGLDASNLETFLLWLQNQSIL